MVTNIPFWHNNDCIYIAGNKKIFNIDYRKIKRFSNMYYANMPFMLYVGNPEFCSGVKISTFDKYMKQKHAKFFKYNQIDELEKYLGLGYHDLIWELFNEPILDQGEPNAENVEYCKKHTYGFYLLQTKYFQDKKLKYHNQKILDAEKLYILLQIDSLNKQIIEKVECLHYYGSGTINWSNGKILLPMVERPDMGERIIGNSYYNFEIYIFARFMYKIYNTNGHVYKGKIEWPKKLIWTKK